ncbi:hypothetical protein MAC_08253 [Metarhizium acridum CQMa 102]|uniref:Endoplasmic reticulum junction formation protein lunapark n=1 Tax=Metarhizium acridum (strain CQMa 102) TaxID=655827 RepID=E9EEF5_METAQ|nr:uncharacterized protein MAC_08253 [Metarhizium acridum CQMa 102]EFY85714.1 hypothetical protein MAC_08253 [Metarhizium acridum CQMa 102]
MGTDSSPESFEKTLSSLSSKITTSQTRLDRLHTSARRTKVLWTLYLSFAYLVYAIVLLLVVGHKNLGAYEWTGMAGGPMLIYVARAVISAYFNFRIDSQATRLKGYQDERANTIQKLKDATKYDSTMELIEKYGGERKKRDEKDAQEDNKQDRDKEAKRPAPPSGTGRTHFPPPPTANIVRPDARQLPPPAPQVQQHEADAEFAPNAYASPPPPRTQYMDPETHWYDRIFDVLLGEDETAAKNRFALICESCRLVNGQAPPGTKSLAEVGMWRCMGCGKTNGEVDEGKRIVEEVLGSKEAQAREEDGAEAEPQVANDAGAEENEGGNRAGAERSR